MACCARAVREHVCELLARPARHGVDTLPGREQQRLEQGVLLWVFSPGWALKPINGRDVDPV